LSTTRGPIAEGRSAYGPVGSPRQVEAKARFDAQIEFGRRIGKYPAAPEPINADHITKETLAGEWRVGGPSTAIPGHMAEQNKQRFDTLAALDDRGLAVMTDELAADLSERPS